MFEINEQEKYEIGRLNGPIVERYYRLCDRCLYEDSNMVIELEEYRVVKHTRCGVWVARVWSNWGGRCSKEKEHFILNGEGKRLAYPTLDLARTSFIRRKEVQISKLNAQLIIATAALKAANDPAFAPDKEFKDETLSGFTSY
jgi:hypothetical protein